jgi:hypothetical protein
MEKFLEKLRTLPNILWEKWGWCLYIGLLGMRGYSKSTIEIVKGV